MKVKALPVFTLFICVLICFSTWKCKTHRHLNSTATFLVSGTVSIKSDYCGGVEPSPEILNAPPTPTSDVTLYIKRGNMNLNTSELIDSIVSGANGNFQINLPPGNYCFVESFKKDHYHCPPNTENSTIDTACFKKQYLKCEYSLDLKSNMSGVNIVLERHCPWTTPCINYRGPLPPAAHPPHQE